MFCAPMRAKVRQLHFASPYEPSKPAQCAVHVARRTPSCLHTSTHRSLALGGVPQAGTHPPTHGAWAGSTGLGRPAGARHSLRSRRGLAGGAPFTRSGTHQAGGRGSDMGKWKEIGRLLIRQAVASPPTHKPPYHNSLIHASLTVSLSRSCSRATRARTHAPLTPQWRAPSAGAASRRSRCR